MSSYPGDERFAVEQDAKRRRQADTPATPPSAGPQIETPTPSGIADPWNQPHWNKERWGPRPSAADAPAAGVQEPCGTCGGEGGYDVEGSDNMDVYRVGCADCNGSGWVEKATPTPGAGGSR